VVRATFLATLVVGLLAAVAGAILSGTPGVSGALIGVGMVCFFFGFGAFVLGVVAGIAPASSLMVAMLTYTLKVVAIALVFAALSTSGALEEDIDAGWLGGVVIVCTLTWLGSQIFFTSRARIPVYDLPRTGPEAGAR
jgi:ATP synthase protein I